MPRYTIRATNNKGEETRGEREAPDALTLARSLRQEGLTLVLATPITANARRMAAVTGMLGRIKFHDKILFADNLGSMITAGLSLSRALEVIERQSSSERFRALVHGVADAVRAGSSLRDALAAQPDIFPPLFVAMVGAGEESGKLPESLGIVAEQMGKSYELRRKVRGAMIYPLVIVCVIILIGILMMIFVVPTLTATFKDLHVDLPLSTRFVIGVSDFVSGHPFLVLLGFPLVLFALYRAFRTSVGKRVIDRLSVRLPLIGPIVLKVNSASTMRTLSSLISSGVPMLEALRITREVLQNGQYRAVINRALEAVEKGRTLSSILKQEERLYPVLVGEMAAVGEETGDLPSMLMKGALFYEKEVDQITKNLSTIIEPVLMVLIGIAVGFFAIAMLSPMYSLTDAIN